MSEFRESPPANFLEQAAREELGRRRFLAALIRGVGAVVTAAVGLPALGYLLSPVLKKQPALWASVSEGLRPAWSRSGSRSADLGDWIRVGPIGRLSVGKPVKFEYAWRKMDGWLAEEGRSALWVVTFDGQEVVAYDNHCTHLGCPYAWQDAGQRFFCPCHDGVFDIEGNVVSGPPPRPLDRYETRLVGGELLIGRLVRGDEL